jgi:uncharacterized protein
MPFEQPSGGSLMYYYEIHSQIPKMLKNLSTFLDKGAAFADGKKIEPEVLLNSRLAPDQFNLVRQVQIACDTAKFAAARLSGKEDIAPVFEDNEKTVADLKARLEKTIKYLKSFSENDFAGANDRRITQKRWEGKTLSGSEYLAEYALPNVYFHVTTAYAILRHNGVDVGKKDFLGELPYKS